MEQFIRLSAIAAPMLQINIDTDQIIPARFLVRTSEAGLGEGLFHNRAHLPDGSLNPDFVLNREPYTHAEILLADRNFGCGSSREAAPRALRQRGFRSVIAPSFGGIFYNNCFRNGILPVELPEAAVRALAAHAEKEPAGKITIDLDLQQVETADGVRHSFVVPPLMRRMLLEGLDEVALTLSRRDEIAAFRAGDAELRPWAYQPGQAIPRS
jgi:3-isopropylmalate/(R)-2-methylmalate dehydratase small subunit